MGDLWTVQNHSQNWQDPDVQEDNHPCLEEADASDLHYGITTRFTTADRLVHLGTTAGYLCNVTEESGAETGAHT